MPNFLTKFNKFLNSFRCYIRLDYMSRSNHVSPIGSQISYIFCNLAFQLLIRPFGQQFLLVNSPTIRSESAALCPFQKSLLPVPAQLPESIYAMLIVFIRHAYGMIFLYISDQAAIIASKVVNQSLNISIDILF